MTDLLGVPSRNSSPGSSIFDYPVEGSGGGGVASVEQPPPGQALPGRPLREELGRAHGEVVIFVVISGGTGCNSIVGAFADSEVAYVLPVSDNGGSSSEIIRVLGGPSIGDLRSRLIRLIPASTATSPSFRATEAIRSLLSHRFRLENTEREARDEWRDIVEGRSTLWKGIPADRKETIRGFLVYFETELLRHAHKNFAFRNGSVGNFLLAAMQLFLRSLPSAIFLFASITGTQSNSSILPVIVTNHTVTIAAELANGRTVIGQCEISHPVRRSRPVALATSWTPPAHNAATFEDEQMFDIQDVGDGQSPEERADPINMAFVKDGEEDDATEQLEARINRLLYLNAYGQEIFPIPNPEFLENLRSKHVLVYSCGSLWTSIIPCLALRGVASAIATSRTLKAKVLLLNAKNDRETYGYTAGDYIRAIAASLNRADLGGESIQPLQPSRRRKTQSSYPYSAFVTHLLYLEGSTVPIDIAEVSRLGVKCVSVPGKKFESRELASSLMRL